MSESKQYARDRADAEMRLAWGDIPDKWFAAGWSLEGGYMHKKTPRHDVTVGSFSGNYCIYFERRPKPPKGDITLTTVTDIAIEDVISDSALALEVADYLVGKMGGEPK